MSFTSKSVTSPSTGSTETSPDKPTLTAKILHVYERLMLFNKYGATIFFVVVISVGIIPLFCGLHLEWALKC